MSDEVTPDEVKAFLKKEYDYSVEEDLQEFAVAPQEEPVKEESKHNLEVDKQGDKTLFKITPKSKGEKEALMDMANAPEKPDKQPPPEKKNVSIDPDPKFDVARKDTNDVMKTYIGIDKFDESLIKLTEDEKEVFLKSTLFDVPAELPIPLPTLNIKVTIRSLNNYENQLIFRAVESDKAAGIISTVSDFVSRLRSYSAAIQVMYFGENKLSSISFKPVDYANPKEIDDHVEELKRHVAQHIMTLNTTRWEATLLALRIFSVKLGKAQEALLNPDFSQPVD